MGTPRIKPKRLSKPSRVVMETRKKHKMNVEPFAKSIGKSAVWLRKLQSGEISQPPYDVLKALVDKYNIDPQDLF